MKRFGRTGSAKLIRSLFRREIPVRISQLGSEAIRYAELGYKVVPLWPGEKTPLPFADTRIPSCEIERVRFWWERCPNANIGIPTGNRYNALIVIDLDVDAEAGIDGKAQMIRMLEQRGLCFPKTGVVRTGSGGYHYYFKNVKGIVIRGEKNLFPGIDIRAEGAHVVAPPSVHANGKSYEWIERNISSIADANEDVYGFLGF